MIRKVVTGLVASMFIGGVLPVVAGDNPELSMVTLPVVSSHVEDRQVIAHGYISSSENHGGFQVWLDAASLANEPDRYVITGKYDRQHELRIFIGRDGWQPVKGGRGIVMLTGDSQAEFDVMADGAQDVSGDEYRVVIHASHYEQH